VSVNYLLKRLILLFLHLMQTCILSLSPSRGAFILNALALWLSAYNLYGSYLNRRARRSINPGGQTQVSCELQVESRRLMLLSAAVHVTDLLICTWFDAITPASCTPGLINPVRLNWGLLIILVHDLLLPSRCTPLKRH
jgi:hypothetical protein